MTGYPVEYCHNCGEPTGHAGADEDSVFDDNGNPLCDGCHTSTEEAEK